MDGRSVLSEPFTLWEACCPSDLFITSGAKGHVIICSRDKGIVNYDIINRKLVQGWPVPFNVKTVSPVIENLGTYSFICDNKTLCRWTHENLNPLEGAIHELSEPSIYRHHPVALGEQPIDILVTKFGIAFLNSETKDTKTETTINEEDHSGRCIYSKMINSSHMELLVTVTHYGGINYKARLYSVEVKKDSKKSQLDLKAALDLNFDEKVTGVLSCIVQGQPLTITVLGDNGKLYIGDLESSITNTDSKNVLLTGQNQLATQTDMKNVQCKLVNVDHSHLALLRVSEKKANCGIITLYSRKYLTKVGEQEFQLSTDNNNEGDSTPKILDAAYCHGYLFIGTSSAVIACEIIIKKPSLASLLGTMENRSNPLSATTEDFPDVIPSLKGNQRKLEENTKLIQKLTSSGKVLLEYEIQKMQCQYVQIRKHSDQHPPVVEGKPKKELNLGPNKRKRTAEPDVFVLKQSHINTVIDRIIKDDRFWCEEMVAKLINQDLISSSYQTKIINRAIEKKSVALLCQLFSHLRGLQESNTIAGLRFALQFELENRKAKISGSRNSDICPPLDFKKQDVEESSPLEPEDPEKGRKSFYIPYNATWPENVSEEHHFKDLNLTCPITSSQIAELLLTIIAVVGNNFMLEHHLQSLAAEETEVFLEFLWYLVIASYPPYKDKRWKKEINISHDKVVDWISRVVNAQFSSLILSPKLKEMLAKLQFDIRQELRLEHSLNILEPLMLKLSQNQGKSVSHKDTSKLYDFRKMEL